MKKTIFWTKEEEELLKENYPQRGRLYCSGLLNRPLKEIGYICVYKLGLRTTKERGVEKQRENSLQRDWSKHKYNVSVNQFKNVSTPEIAYILGLLWADGYVLNRGKGKVNSISLQCLLDDILELKPIFDRTGLWLFYTHKNPNGKVAGTLTTNNRPLVEYLVKMNYKVKSQVSADKIINTIPEHLHTFFFRGLVDGDGCFYKSSKNNGGSFSISSSYNQDWTYIKKLFDTLHITNYHIYQRRYQTGANSSVMICAKKELKKIIDFLYGSNLELGLRRKREKAFFIYSYGDQQKKQVEKTCIL